MVFVCFLALLLDFGVVSLAFESASAALTDAGDDERGEEEGSCGGGARIDGDFGGGGESGEFLGDGEGDSVFFGDGLGRR